MSVLLGERIQRPECPSFMVQGETVDFTKVAHVICIVSWSRLYINEQNQPSHPDFQNKDSLKRLSTHVDFLAYKKSLS